MKIYQIALTILVFSLISTTLNQLGVFNYKSYEIGANISTSNTTGIYEIDSGSGIDSEKGWTDKIADTLGLSWLLNALRFIKTFLGVALNPGHIFENYIPGDVGFRIGIIANILVYAIYLWGGVQLLRKVSSKQMD